MSNVQFCAVAIIICTCLVFTHCQKTDHIDTDRQDEVVSITGLCKQLCTRLYRCPPECMNVYAAKTKRLGGLEGLTFDDYIFMRLLGRDMSHRKIY